MTWEWVVVIVAVAVWTMAAQALHTWKEVSTMRMWPQDLVAEIVREGK